MPGVCSCNEGYQRSDVDAKCIPKCNSACLHGFCSAPAECTCNDGYAQFNGSADSDCSPVCDTDCHNGKCIAPNECGCNTGYKISEIFKTNCDPVCEKPCGQGICVGPNKCRCNDGYLPGVDDANPICVPQCHNGCINGNCIAPNVCNCSDGYVFDSLTHTRSQYYHILTLDSNFLLILNYLYVVAVLLIVITAQMDFANLLECAFATGDIHGMVITAFRYVRMDA